jgi:hypothetical protein
VALAVAPALRGRRPALALAPALAASAALHGAGDLSLALSRVGYTGYALALAAPALVLFARARRRPLPSPASQGDGGPGTRVAPEPVAPAALK